MPSVALADRDNKKYGNSSQQDAQEFLTDLLEVLDGEFSDSKQTSPISNHIETDDPNRIGEFYHIWKRDYYHKTKESEISDLFAVDFLQELLCTSCKKTKFSFSFSSNLPLEISESVEKEICNVSLSQPTTPT
jgi:ubiquitin C-terminal hydrolase